jgi:hypothetical protein
MSPELGRVVLIIGIALVVVGGLAMLGVRLPFGRLPGDIAIEGERGGVYIPIVSMIVISVILTILVNLFLRRQGASAGSATRGAGELAAERPNVVSSAVG